MSRCGGTVTARVRFGVLVVAIGLCLAACSSAAPAANQQTSTQTPPSTPETPATTSSEAASQRPTPPTRAQARRARADAPRLPDDFRLALETVADGLNQPTFVTAPPGDVRLFIVEKTGRIRIVEDGDLHTRPFLNIRGRVLASGQTSEQGMFALAFHPEYATNGRFYVHYTARPDGDTRVEEYQVSPSDPGRARPATRRTILKVDQPFRWHNGGMLQFGPDGMLWIGLGDGGVKNDPDGHGQNPRTLLGTILRLDVDERGDGTAYGIPPDNPFVDGGGAPEVWAYGLRNPWRFDIDPRRRLLYIGDVGEYRYEEVNIVRTDRPGRNFGWAVREGSECFAESTAGCASKGMVDPAFEYLHDDSCAVVGGHVYRGEAIPELRGRYFYADFCNGGIHSFRYTQKGRIVERRDWTDQLGQVALPTSFGVDANGELYVTSAKGAVHRIVGDGAGARGN